YQKYKDGVKIKLTKDGRAAINDCKIDLLEIKKPEKWDKKWRMVIFDIPHNKRKSKDALRWKLKSLGFFHFQKSVFIHPYECQREIKELVDLYGVSENVKMVLVEKIDGENLLKDKFNLA
ncbi:CRISPR-associated endonuclease Cas2, partial [Candidatus Azambacteria bacterium RIFCSPLOWO2_01_FULL_37_9]